MILLESRIYYYGGENKIAAKTAPVFKTCQDFASAKIGYSTPLSHFHAHYHIHDELAENLSILKSSFRRGKG